MIWRRRRGPRFFHDERSVVLRSYIVPRVLRQKLAITASYSQPFPLFCHTMGNRNCNDPLFRRGNDGIDIRLFLSWPVVRPSAMSLPSMCSTSLLAEDEEGLGGNAGGLPSKSRFLFLLAWTISSTVVCAASFLPHSSPLSTTCGT